MIYERKRKEINAFAGDEAKDTKGGEKLFRFFISLRCSPVWNGNWTKKFYQILSFNWIGIKINNKEQEWQTTIEELKKCKMEIGAFGVWVDHEIWGYHLPLWILIRFPKLFQKYKIVTNEYWSPSQLKTTPGVINLFQNSCSKKLPQIVIIQEGRHRSFLYSHLCVAHSSTWVQRKSFHQTDSGKVMLCFHLELVYLLFIWIHQY